MRREPPQHEGGCDRQGHIIPDLDPLPRRAERRPVWLGERHLESIDGDFFQFAHIAKSARTLAAREFPVIVAHAVRDPGTLGFIIGSGRIEAMTDTGDTHRHLDTPSGWVYRWSEMIPAGGRVLDVACGGGRHTRWLAGRGHPIEAVDRDPVILAGLEAIPGVTTRRADLESGPWPYPGQCFAAVVVVNYLHRPLFPHLLAALAPGGVLIYETFAMGNERYGRPTNPDFLLKPGELLEVVRGRLRVLAYEDVFVPEPRPAMVQRICAVKSSP